MPQTAQIPDDIYGSLFVDIQLQRIFPDNKTFVDCVPKQDPEAIVKAYEAQKSASGFSLANFVKEHFEAPKEADNSFQADTSKDVTEHLRTLWEELKRAPTAQVKGSSLLAVPNPFIIPGGRFRETYYWDTYFTMLGLEVSGLNEMVEHMVDNFDYMIKTYGHIPNGNRSYYLSRSQPPFFALMVDILAGIKGEATYKSYKDSLQMEYDYWTDKTAPTKHTVHLPGDVVLQRYWDQLDRPRQESYCEDYTCANGKPNEKEMYRNFRSAAESGWDFSSRWFSTFDQLSTIRTTDIIPVDLNCLLQHLELTLARAYQACGDSAKSDMYKKLAEKRREAINTIFYNSADGWYYDYLISEKRLSECKTLAGIVPFFLQVAPAEYADRAAGVVEQCFLRPGGVVTTLVKSGQQWDAPNGWPPLQWMTIYGLEQYGKKDLAKTIASRWINLCVKVYKSTGKMMEKYNVEDTDLTAGGGEYPSQDGFGWTNGILLRLLKDYS